jgi:hypothetical protein
MERRKPGRPSKGHRKPIRVNLPTELAAALQAQAAREGMTVTDVLGELAAWHTGVPYAPGGQTQVRVNT